MDELTRLSEGKYLSLTTFRKSGEAVATPVWVTREGDHLYVITDAQSGKVKRLRNNNQVLLAPCDVRGSITGTQVGGTVDILDESGTRRVERLINSRYGLMARAINAAQWLRTTVTRKPAGTRVGLQITPDEQSTTPTED